MADSQEAGYTVTTKDYSDGAGLHKVDVIETLKARLTQAN